MKIYVVGVGGVGGYLGGMLAKAGKDVTFVARGDLYKKMKFSGLSIESVRNGNFSIKPVKVISDVSQITDPDLIFVTVKTYDNEEVAKKLASVVASDSSVITFQNGVENDLTLKKFVKKGSVYPGLAYIVSTRGELGVVKQISGPCKFIFGDRKGSRNKNLEKIEEELKGAGIDVLLSDDIERDAWQKYVFICGMTGLSAFARVPVGTVMADPLLRQLYARALKEAILVGRAEGINLPLDVFEKVMGISEKTDKNARFSMLIDIENGRRTEIETLNGTIVRLARKHRIDVPVNETIYGVIKSIS